MAILNFPRSIAYFERLIIVESQAHQTKADKEQQNLECYIIIITKWQPINE